MSCDAEVRGGEEMYPLKNIEAERARAGMTRKELADSLNVTEQTLRMRASTAAVCSRRRLSASLTAWLARYNCQIIFCEPATTGKLIREVLYRELKERLEVMECPQAITDS